MSTWLRVCRVLSWLVLAAGLVMVGVGLWFVADDYAVRTEQFDGLGAALGLLGAGFGLLCAAVAAVILLLIRKAPVAAAWAAAVVYGAAALLALLLWVLGLTG